MTPLFARFEQNLYSGCQAAAVCAPFLCQVAREFRMVTFIIASKLWFPTTFLDPNNPQNDHSVAVGFYGQDSRVFSKTWLQHSTKKIVPPSGFYMLSYY
jgi:hypothetical protein